ncbi:hypothetical protein CLV96_3542 [Leptospira meyeri]|uniref:Uncharacterized protein n=1 Tax=Leptospira meyeri TaxID=29508 RepID=A0A4R8MLI7_LEPME|nr:hypothetical protein [Leptospira meyeri]EKJ87256.1 hypothetical protein LEP1GSC017_0764 [Leptospira meyeri serovar Hardjo str. Went 5]TDY67986.1 hypothetical protein CLV96_3542 [Leptospira meyeri]TGL51960.1 hypothetical protein EHQ55_04880 [Leptospira meyeri]
MFKAKDLVSSSFPFQKNKSLERMFYLTFFYFILFLSLLFLNCAKEETKPDKTNTLGLLGLASGNQISSNSDNGQSEGGLLPPIPPVVGPPANPGQPLNAPILNDPQTQVNNAPLAEDQYGIYGKILINNISFQLPVHDQTTITAYIGKRNLRLEPDGTVVNATNFKTFTPANPNLGGTVWFSFIHRSNQKQKLILVARNEFGSSSKEINFSHNRDCLGAPLAPTTLGDCNGHCIEVTNVAGQWNFKANYKHGDGITFANITIEGYAHTTGAMLGFDAFEYLWDPGNGLPLPEGFVSVSSMLSPQVNEHTCVLLQSIIWIEDENGNLNTTLFTDRARLE